MSYLTEIMKNSRVIAWASEAIADDYDEMASRSMDLANLASALGQARQSTVDETSDIPVPVRANAT